MKTDVENSEWKAEAPYLASLPRENPFLVPERYFDTLTENIANSVYVNELKEVTPVSGFDVPDQYFSSLKNRILAQTTQEVFGAAEPSGNEEVLSSLPPAAGFSVPEQYFQKLQSKILAQTVEEAPPPAKESKIIRLWHSGLLKYASAACFVLVAAFGFYLNKQTYVPEPTATEIANEQMLYDIDEQDIIDHVEGNAVDEQKNNATNAELESYILTNYSQNDLSSAL
jgi:hypothetical protein